MRNKEIIWPCEVSKHLRDLLLAAKSIYVLGPDEVFSIGRGSGRGLAYVMEGLVIGRMTASRRLSPFVLFDEGSWFGGSQLYKESDLSYRFVAVGEAKLLHIPADTIKNAAELYGEVFKLLYFVTSEPANKTVGMLFASSSLRLPQRVAYLLLEVSKRFPLVVGSSPMITVSQAVLAQVLGLSRSKLNQELQSLQRKGAISVDRKRIVIINPHVLRQLTEGGGEPARLP